MLGKEKISCGLEAISYSNFCSCSKTTCVQRLVDHITVNHPSVICQGFLTQEVRSSTGRLGFDIVSVPSNERTPLARKTSSGVLPSNYPRTGRYSVDVAALERVALPLLRPSGQQQTLVYVLDEIGKMELHSTQFRRCVEQLLATDDSIRLIGTVAQPGRGVPFCNWVARHPNVEVHTVTEENRDHVANTLIEQMGEWLI